MASTQPEMDEPDNVVDSAPEDSTRYSRSDKLLYLMDNVFSTRYGQLTVLFGSCIVYVAICGAVYMAVNKVDFWNGVWESWTFMADPGTHSGTPENLESRIVAFFITWGGIVFFSVIIGFVYDAIQEKMDALKKGKSIVVEKDHTLMLGWTSFSLSFILEICDANSSEGGGVIVVLAEQEKEIVERDFYSSIKKPQLMGSKVVFRSGSALSKHDLLKVSAHTARSILVLAQDQGDADKKDAITLRTVLTLKGMESLRGHIVAELRDVDNERMVQLVGGQLIETVVSHDIIGRLLLMSARTPGLANVYGEILGFDGDEFYMQEWPELTGVPFGSMCTRMPDATPFGIKIPGLEAGEFTVELIPSLDRKLMAGEEVIVLAEDDDTYSPKPDCINEINIGEVSSFAESPKVVEDILIVGWRRDIRDMFMLLDSMVMKGSKVHLMALVPLEDRYKILLQGGFNPAALQNFTLVHHEGNPASRKELEMLPVETYTSVIILADQTLEFNITESDSQTLATLLLLRDIQQRREKEYANSGKAAPRRALAQKNNSVAFDNSFRNCPIICEILDTRTQKTIASNKYVNQTSEFIQSNQLISQALAMIAENRAVQKILAELLGSDGCDLCLQTSSRYVNEGEKTTFMVIVKRAQCYDEVILGFQDGPECFMNPKNKLKKRSWDNVQFVSMKKGEIFSGGADDQWVPSVAGGTEEFDAAYTKSFVGMNDRLGSVCKDIKGMANDAQKYLEDTRRQKIMSPYRAK